MPELSSQRTRNANREPAIKRAARGDASLELWSRPGYLIRRLHQIHHALFLEECQAFKVTPVQYGLLSALLDKRELDQVSLGSEVGLDRTNVADVLARLEKRGLLRRRANPEDARARLASLTPKGRQLALRMSAPMRRAQDRLLAPLNQKNRQAFVTMLAALVQANNEFGRTVLNT
jgi:DNA-binding MarR family transcriptional regulator